MRTLLTSPRAPRAAGFTLIELLIVVIIIGILIAIGVPAYLKYVAAANDRDAQAALQVAYKAAIAGDTEVNSSRFPIASTVVNDIKTDEPQAAVARGSCLSSVATAPVKQVLVDPSSTTSQITLCTKSVSGTVWKLVGPLTGSPTVADGSSVQLTMTGNEITDATRAAAAQGDGLVSDSSTGVWEATTNVIPNGGFETNPATWQTDGTSVAATLTRDTTTSKFGAASGKITATGAGPGQMFYDNQVAGSYTAGTKYTFSVWVKGTGSTVGKNIHLQLSASGGANGFANLASATNTPLTANWQRLAITGTVDFSDRTALVAYPIVSGVVAGDAYFIDGAQLEQRPFATPYVDTNGVAASRAASRIQAPAALLTPAQGWFVARVRPAYPSSAPAANARVFWLAADASGTNRLSLGLTTGIVQLIANNGSTEINSFFLSWNAGDVLTLIGAWTPSNLYISANGSAFQSLPRTQIPSGTLTLDIGSQQTAGWFDGDFLWAATGTGTLSDADAALINSWGSNDPKRASFPTSAQATMVWDGAGAVGSLK